MRKMKFEKLDRLSIQKARRKGENVKLFSPPFALAQDQGMKLLSIELNEFTTVVHMEYTDEAAELRGKLVKVEPNVYIQPVNTPYVYYMFDHENISLESYMRIEKKKGERLIFSMIFPPLPYSVRKIDLIEGCCRNDFAFQGITLRSCFANEKETFSQN